MGGVCLALLLLFSLAMHPSDQRPDRTELNGIIRISGSGTLYPLSKAIGDLYTQMYPQVEVVMQATGTGKGFSIFARNESSINNASRPIKPKELDALYNKNIRFYEFPVASDGITVITHNDNNFAESLTPDELKMIFKADSDVRTWSDIRSSWPDEPIEVYGPNTTHGTFDFFTGTILGSKEVRGDYNAIQSYDEIIAQVAVNRYAIGYVGFANYNNNRRKVQTVAIDNGNGPVAPSFISINRDQYKPLSRKMYVYVNAEAAERPEVRKYVTMYLKSASLYCSKLGFVPLKKSVYSEALRRLEEGQTGSSVAELSMN